GRAVNQSVVLSYVAVWLMNSFYNTAYLSFFPDAVGFRG
ncbi:MAG: hypothetical protein QOF01_4643, partial [Thermomicrobiales bacterium]|nr:hypothetical protein [Thermomicrobiales bacterium]